jgi:hypothetical protein
MDDDPFNRRPPLSPFLEDVRRAQEPAGLVATLGAILGGLVLMFPFGCVMAPRVERVRRLARPRRDPGRHGRYGTRDDCAGGVPPLGLRPVT